MHVWKYIEVKNGFSQCTIIHQKGYTITCQCSKASDSGPSEIGT